MTVAPRNEATLCAVGAAVAVNGHLVVPTYVLEIGLASREGFQQVQQAGIARFMLDFQVSVEDPGRVIALAAGLPSCIAELP